MPTQDEMTIDERRKYVKLMEPRYRKAKRKERSQLLSEMEQVSKLHRKHLIRLLNGESLDRKKRSTPRSRRYGLEVERVVLRVWESLDYCHLSARNHRFSDNLPRCQARSANRFLS